VADEIVPEIEREENNLKLACIGIGTHERALEFCNHTGFASMYLYSDPENVVYDALELVKSTPANLFTDFRTPLSILKRSQEQKSKYLTNALSKWGGKMWIPPKLEQGLQQGGAFVFLGKETMFAYRDPSAGAHVDLNLVLSVALQASSSQKSKSE